ncbi:MAG: biotin/lipoyl-containing protein [Rhodothalassiaceae bacterium]
MPQLGESVDEGTIAVWHKKPGDQVAVDEVLLEVETDKVATEVPALISGVLRKILVPEGETVKVGTKLAVIEEAGDRDPAAPPPARPAPAGRPASGGGGSAATVPAPAQGGRRGALPKRAPDGTPLSPAVRRLIAHHGLDPAAIRGSGRGGRIQRADVLAHLAARHAAAPAAPAATEGEVEIVPFTRMRRRIAAHMQRSKATSAHVLQAIEVDFSNVAAARDFLKEAWRARHGAGTRLPFCLPAARIPVWT